MSKKPTAFPALGFRPNESDHEFALRMQALGVQKSDLLSYSISFTRKLLRETEILAFAKDKILPDFERAGSSPPLVAPALVCPLPAASAGHDDQPQASFRPPAKKTINQTRWFGLMIFGAGAMSAGMVVGVLVARTAWQ